MTDATRAPRRILVLGATSAIAEQACRLWAAQGARFALVGRKAARLGAVADDLKARGAAAVVCLDADLGEGPRTDLLETATRELGGLDVALLAYGVLGGAPALSPAEAGALLSTNFVSAAQWCLAIAAALEQQRYGTLVVIGSVAGDRGRQSNFIYGAAKAGLGVLVQGLAHRLARVGARAVLVKPGLVDTPMTAHMRKGPLWSRPEAVAQVIVSAADRGPPVVYAPHWWRWVMMVIRALPTPVMHRTKL